MPQWVHKVQEDGTVRRYPASPEAKVIVQDRGFKHLGYIPVPPLGEGGAVAVHPSGHPVVEGPVHQFAPEPKEKPLQEPMEAPASSALPKRRGRPPKPVA